MAEQESKTVFWDRHEAALLIDLCLQVHAGKIKRAEGLAQLSARLRHRAKLMGRKIDENFRSAASLANYYAMIEYLITDGLRGEPEAAPILASVYKTFISEPDEFRKILDEAEHQCRKKVFEFDTHEVIKMVEASVKLNTLDNIGEAVNDLAKLLQDYAKKRGVDDSDISRDVSAIAKRINVIDGLRRGRQTDSATPREVFLVKLYKYDPEKFRALLSEANKALGIETHMPSPDIIAEALKTHFPGGFKYASAIAKKQLRHCLDENELRDISDEQLIKALRAITVESNGKLFLPYDEQQSQLVEEIKSTAANILDSGFSCIYVDKLFERFADRLTDLLHFGSATDLMERMGWDKNILTRGVPDINADVQKFFREAGHPISYVELEKAMWFLPFDKLKTAVIASPNIICVKSETYMDIAAFPLKDGDRHKAEQLIKGVLATVPSISIEECRRSIYKEFPEIVNATSDYTTQGFGNVLRGMFGNRFSFNRNMISAASEVVSKRQLFVDFCNERKNFTLDELQAFAEEINSQIEFKSVRRVAVRIAIWCISM